MGFWGVLWLNVDKEAHRMVQPVVQALNLFIYTVGMRVCVFVCCGGLVHYRVRLAPIFSRSPWIPTQYQNNRNPEIRILSDSSKIPNPSAKLLSLKSHIAKPTRLKPGAPKLEAASKGPQMLNPYLKGSWDFHGSFKKGSIRDT